MPSFKIVPLAKSYAEKVRRTKKDEYGHPVFEQLATGRGPCRVSLKPFVPGHDKRILFSHSPFALDNAYNQPGPVFIHAQEVEEYADIHHFPAEIKADKIHFHLTLIGYDLSQQMIYSKMVGERDVDEMIEEIFENRPDISFLHARSAEACCFICKIERI
jgi:Protein of unknown function (DUF1203)